jgi:hypothetical protein
MWVVDSVLGREKKIKTNFLISPFINYKMKTFKTILINSKNPYRDFQVDFIFLTKNNNILKFNHLK